MIPCCLLLNTRSLLPKLDELTALLRVKPVDIIAITESWLHDHIDSNLLSIEGYNLLRKDRAIGGVGESVFTLITTEGESVFTLKCLLTQNSPPFFFTANDVMVH